MTLLLLVCNIAAITIVARSVNAQEPSPGMLLDLLEKPSANRTLVTTIVECLEDPTGRKTTPAFLKCINGYLHVHNRTKFDSIGFILGNYLVKSAMKLVLSDEKDFYDRTKVFGDCIPVLLRNLFGVEEFSFSCKKRSYIENYDESDDEDFEEGDGSYDY